MKLLSRWLPLFRFRGSGPYWERRYRLGGDSGAGSYGQSAAYKAAVLNAFIERWDVHSAIEFGCGDGHQLGMLRVNQYTGTDISETTLARCRVLYASDPTKTFLDIDAASRVRSDLALSLDVLFHLVEDPVYLAYLDRLFGAADRYVVIFTSNVDEPPRTLRHVRHRRVERDLAERYPHFVRMHDEEAGLPPNPDTSPLAARFFLLERATHG